MLRLQRSAAAAVGTAARHVTASFFSHLEPYPLAVQALMYSFRMEALMEFKKGCAVTLGYTFP
jgi:hypothetical protein